MAAAPAPIAFGDLAPGKGSTAPEADEPVAEVEEPGAAVNLAVHTGSLRGAQLVWGEKH